MAKNIDKNEKLSLNHKILLFLHRNGVIFLVLLGLIALTLITIAVVSNISSRNLETDTQKIESIQDEYSSYMSMTDKTKKAELKKKIMKDLNLIIKKGSKTYPLERALFIEGNIFYANSEWVKSSESFDKLAKLFPKSYLAAVALLNSSAAYEENKDIDKAIERYQQVLDNYSQISPDIPNVLFSIGRLYEEKNDIKAARKSYNNLIDRFPGSNWTKLARSRIIYLDTLK